MLGPLVVKSANCLSFIGSSEVCDSVQSLQTLAFLHKLTKLHLLVHFHLPKPISSVPYPAPKAEQQSRFRFVFLTTKWNFALFSRTERPFMLSRKMKHFCLSSSIIEWQILLYSSPVYILTATGVTYVPKTASLVNIMVTEKRWRERTLYRVIITWSTIHSFTLQSEATTVEASCLPCPVFCTSGQ